VIGEMTDLDAAKIDDVKDWFSKYYGPSNAVIALSGDITLAEAKAKVETYFGAIPPGPPVARQKGWIAPRSGEQRAVAEDQVTLARLTKVWNVPGFGEADVDYLDLFSIILALDKDSRLYRRLVYQDKIAKQVVAYDDTRELAGLFEVQITASPGVSLDRIEAVFNEEMAKLLRDGPTPAEVERAKTRIISGFIRGLERVGGFGGTSDILAMCEAYGGSPDAWKPMVERTRTATAAQVQAAARRWLSDGGFTLDIKPFGTRAPSSQKPAATPPAPTLTASPGFGQLHRAKLANGLNLVVVERHATPTLDIGLVLDGGDASDPFAKPGTAGLSATVLMDGTAKLDAMALSERIGSLGVTMFPLVGKDFTAVAMTSFTTRLDPALDLFADVVLHPAYRPEDVAREKALAIASIQQTKDRPVSAAVRVLFPLVYGPAHAYGKLETEASVSDLTPEDLRKYHDVWFQPDGATLVVVGDTTLDQVLPKIEARFGAWKPVKLPAKSIGPVAQPAAPVVYLIDKPGAVQSVILAAETAPPRLNPDDIAIEAMNTVLGGAFTSRLNMNLRETKHWSYGSSSFVIDARGPGVFAGYASVQTDKTAESFAEMRKELNDIVSTRPVTQEELTLAQNDLTHSLPGRWETGWAVAGSVREIVGYGLPDDYYSTYAQHIRALTTADLDRAAHTVVRPSALTWVIVGDRAKVEPSLKALGLDIHPIDADAKPVER
jgi:zinc protease